MSNSRQQTHALSSGFWGNDSFQFSFDAEPDGIGNALAALKARLEARSSKALPEFIEETVDWAQSHSHSQESSNPYEIELNRLMNDAEQPLATQDWNTLKAIVSLADKLEQDIVDANNPMLDGLLDQTRSFIDYVIDVFNENNIFRNGPSYEASHVNWILGQNLETFESVDGVWFNEGNIDYFNVNTGGRDNLYGEGFQGAGNNNVNASLKAANAGSTMTVGIEFQSYDGREISGVEAMNAMWLEYEARKAAGETISVLDIVTQYSQGDFEPFTDLINGTWTPDQWELQADSLLSFAQMLRDDGAHIGSIHVRPGYEFDAEFNDHADISGTAAEYINSFKLVAELLKAPDSMGLSNVEMVWQSQSGAEREPGNPIYDEANGADAPITKQDVYDHLDLWYPGDDYVDIVGVSYFQSEESARSWSFADGTADTGQDVIDDFDIFFQAFADYARDHGKKLDISESTPAGVYTDRDQFNEVVATRLEELGPDYDGPIRFLEEGELAYAKFHAVADASGDDTGVLIDQFFDESDPLFYISSTAQVWNEFFVPFLQYVGENADIVDSVNMISYNWDEISVFDSLETGEIDRNNNVNFGSGNWWENPELAPYVNAFAIDLFG